VKAKAPKLVGQSKKVIFTVSQNCHIKMYVSLVTRGQKSENTEEFLYEYLRSSLEFRFLSAEYPGNKGFKPPLDFFLNIYGKPEVDPKIRRGNNCWDYCMIDFEILWNYFWNYKKICIKFHWNSWNYDGILEFLRKFLGFPHDKKFQLFPPRKNLNSGR
jgi:hypothetical protein